MRGTIVRSTSDLPGTGGSFKVDPGDFLVEEVPAYLPQGEGPHTFLLVEKRGIDTLEAVARLASALGKNARDAGYAGMKDRQAVTRQWISLPDTDPAVALALQLPELKVLEAARHRNKLKTGHLRGNRFEILVRGVGADGLERARAILAVLAERGLPNFYGTQRFGHDGQNAEQGLALVRGTSRARDARRARLMVSALQSELFNRWLEARITAGTVRTVRPGEILQKVESGGMFASTDPAVDQARVDAWQCVPTGPMFGWKMMQPAEGSVPFAEEAACLLSRELDADAFAAAPVRRIAEGTRRAALVRPGDLEVRQEADDVLWLRFSLPSGSYATVLLGEVIG